jgi:hypothetical protein
MQHEGIGPDPAALLARVPGAIGPLAISAVFSVLASMAAAIAAIAPILPAAEGGRPAQGQNVIIEIARHAAPVALGKRPMRRPPEKNQSRGNQNRREKTAQLAEDQLFTHFSKTHSVGKNEAGT